MASTQQTPLTAKLSFAKVAAMNAPLKSLPLKSAVPDERRNMLQEVPPPKQAPQPVVQRNIVLRPPPTVTATDLPKSNGESRDYGLPGAIEGLSLVDKKPAATNGNGTASAGSGESLADDQSNLSNSSFKQPGFDTKSMASVTTFAMDEKESIRPDDSASMRAADDDDISSVVTKSYQHDQDPLVSVSRNPLRNSIGPVTIPGRRFHTLTLTNPPRFGDLPVSPEVGPQLINEPVPVETALEIPEDLQARSPTIPVRPDEKLLDALASPMQRLPLLQLEEKFLTFLTQSVTLFMDLPPQNAFSRMLAYKLADYYCLGHQMNEDGMSIRITKIGNVIMPTPLHVVAKSIPTGSAHLPNTTAFKIMRRAGVNHRQASAGTSTAASSSAPSKATSEAGAETHSEEGLTSPGEGTPGREKAKLTREEREAQYKAARDRIFSDFQESAVVESVSNGDQSANMSRSSSSSGRRKIRKNKTKDDSFEARSAFVAGYNAMHAPGMSQPYVSQYAETLYQAPFMGPGNGYGAANAFGTTPTQAYPGFQSEMGYAEPQSYAYNQPYPYEQTESWTNVPNHHVNNYANFGPATNTPNPTGSHPSMQLNQHFLPSNSAPQHNQTWNNSQYGQAYDQAHANLSHQNMWNSYSTPPNVMPQYGYGPNQNQTFGNPTTFDHQRNMSPGSQRTLFNPQTRSFVPNNVQARSGKNGRKKTVVGTSQPRYGSNNLQRTISSENSNETPRAPPRRQDYSSSNISSPKPREESLQQKYGAPANLPKKPPPSQVPSSFDADPLYKGNNAVGSMPVGKGPQVVNGSIPK